MVQRPDGLRIHFNDEQRRKPRRSTSGCFRPPSKLTLESDKKQINKCLHGGRRGWLKSKADVRLGHFAVLQTLITVCHPGVLYRLQSVGGRNARFPLWATCVQLPLPASLCNAKEGEDMSCGCATFVSRLASSRLYWCLLGGGAVVCFYGIMQFEMALTCTRHLGSDLRSTDSGWQRYSHLLHIVSHSHKYI